MNDTSTIDKKVMAVVSVPPFWATAFNVTVAPGEALITHSNDWRLPEPASALLLLVGLPLLRRKRA